MTDKNQKLHFTILTLFKTQKGSPLPAPLHTKKQKNFTLDDSFMFYCSTFYGI